MDGLRTAPPRTGHGHYTDLQQTSHGLRTDERRTHAVREERGGVFAAAFCRLSVRASDVGRSRYGRMADKPGAIDVRARDRFGTAHGLCMGGVRLRFAAGALCVRASDG